MAKEYKYKDVVLVAEKAIFTCVGCYFLTKGECKVNLEEIEFPFCDGCIYIEKPKP